MPLLEEQVNILIVDDRPDGLLTLEAVLKRPDYNLIRASTGREAFARLMENEFALILLDVQMPDLDGFQTATLIKQESKLSDIPIIFVTAISKEEKFVYLGYGVGAVDYVFKPFDAHVLQSKVNVFVDLYRKQRKIIQQAELILRNERLENERQIALKAAQARSDFFAGMSHDIRTPMNCIIGMADLLSQTHLNLDQANYVQTLNKASENLLGLVNNILDLSKLESGQFEIERIEFDLFEAVESLLDITSPRAHSKGLELILKIEPGVPRFLMGDANRTKQILINLLGNAVKFTAAGEIVLSISSIVKDDTSAHLLFAVKDSGIGIASEQISKVFDHFAQGASDPKLKREGSGLGLSICKRLAKLMGANIRVESKLGEGSTFSVEIPFSKCPVPEAEKKLLSLDLRDKNVLIVDDNAAVCAGLAETCYEWGATVRSATSKEEAIQITNAARARGIAFDFVFIDIRMPGIASGGFETLEQLGKNLSGSVIMMLPTNHRHGDLQRLKSAGLNYFLIKPIKPLALKEVVENAILKANSKLLGQPDANVRLKPLRLLVVDDSEDNRFLIDAYFRNTPFKVEMAEDGQVAIEKFKKGRFDLVLMDLQMPIMDGYAALSAIREWELQAGRVKTPVVALTAFALKEEAEKSLAAGFTAHITKPIRKSHLINAVLGNAT